MKYTDEETLDRIANAYNTNFWHEGEGFGIYQRPEDKIIPNVPAFLRRYVKENSETSLARELIEKIEQVESKVEEEKNSQETLIRQGEKILSEQNADGSFPFNPDLIGKDDFKVATSFIEPMGIAGETALDVSIRPALRLFDIAKQTG